MNVNFSKSLIDFDINNDDTRNKLTNRPYYVNSNKYTANYHYEGQIMYNKNSDQIENYSFQYVPIPEGSLENGKKIFPYTNLTINIPSSIIGYVSRNKFTI
jgi:hypothetical protein